MSRWIEEFEVHPFQEVWNTLKINLEESTVDDETVITTVQEMARLRKAVSYVDGIISGIDPELVPLSTWDSFNSQATACNQQISSYNSNKNITHLTNANNHVDNLLTYVRPYMILEGKISEALQRSIKRYAETVDEYGENLQEGTAELIEKIREYKDQGDNLFTGIENTNETVNNYRNDLFGDDAGNLGVKNKIEELFDEITEKHGKINGFFNETLVGNEDEISTKKSVLEAKKAIEGEQEKIEGLLRTVEMEIKELGRFHMKVFGEKVDDGEPEGGLSSDLDQLMTDMTTFEKKQNAKYNALNEQIEELLPGATSAGLATAYKDVKETFNGPILRASLVFYISIICLVVVSLFVAIKSFGINGIEFIEVGDWTSVLKGLISKLPFYAPILWLAYYATKRRSEYQRLQQEYAHKESLAKSYNSFKKQILALGDDENVMLKKFIMKAVDAIAYNASTTLDGKHGDKMPAHEMIEKTVEKTMKSIKP